MSTTDADGIDVVQVPPESLLRVEARADGYLDRCAYVRSGRVGEAPANVLVRLVPDAVIRGVVRDPDGALLEGAKVTATLDGMEAADIEASELNDSTREEGTYAIGGLVPGHAYRIRAWHMDRGYSPVARVVVDRTSRASAVNLVLLRYGRIAVHLTDEQGAVVRADRAEDADVNVESPDPDQEWVRLTPGAFRVSPGRWTIWAAVKGFALAWTEVDVDPGASVTVPLRLSRGVAIGGVVVDDRGEPVGAASVQALASDRPRVPEDDVETPSARTRDDGSFRIGSLRRAPHDLLVSGPAGDHEPAPVHGVPAPSEGMRIVLPRRGRIRFRLVDDAWPQRHWSGSVRVVGRAANRSSLEERQSILVTGEVDLPWFSAASPEITIHAVGYGDVSRSAVVEPGAVVNLGEVRLVRATTTLVGIVRLFDGRPATCAKLTLLHAGPSERRFETQTNGAGRFLFKDVMPLGRARLSVTCLDAPPLQMAVDVGSSPSVEITMPEGGVLQVFAADASGCPAPPATVRVRDARGATVAEGRTHNGVYDCLLAPGTYVVDVAGDNAKTAEVRAGDATVVDVTLH